MLKLRCRLTHFSPAFGLRYRRVNLFTDEVRRPVQALKPSVNPSRPSALSGQLLDIVVGCTLALISIFVYAWTAGPLLYHQSSQPHFVLLADAILHGHLWIDPVRAVHLGDITPAGGRYYVSFPPMPALLLLPFVAAWGSGFDDVLFSVGLGAINVGLAYALIRRLSVPGFLGKGIDLGRRDAAAIALLLAFGSVHYDSVVAGTVWYLAHVVSVTFVLLYLIECAGQGRPLVAGLAIAAAFLARTPTVFAVTLWLVFAVRKRNSWGELATSVVLIGAPVVAAASLLLGQNFVRFGSPFDFGYFRMRIAGQLAPDLSRYGQFSLHFLGRNLWAFLFSPPKIRLEGLFAWLLSVPNRPQNETTPRIDFDPWGTGIWAVSPTFGYSLRFPGAGQLLLSTVAWASAVLVAIPDLLYYNTGWYQYGYRFSLDFTPFLLVLTAIGLRRPLHPIGRAVFGTLLLVSVASNFLGARWFVHLPPY